MTDTPKDPHEKYVAGLEIMEDTRCVVCEEGALTVSTFTKTRRDEGTTLIVKEVPALLCDACGDVTYTQAIGQRLDEYWEAAVEADRTTIVHAFSAEDD